MVTRVLPELTAENHFFWTSGADGRLRMLRCTDCSHFIHPPAPTCPQCLGDRLSPTPLSGTGTVCTFTVNMKTWLPGFEAPYMIAMVELAEQPGLRVTTNIVECEPLAVSIGMPVEVVFEQCDDVWIPLFRPRDVQ